jgi:hypothetical protein
MTSFLLFSQASEKRDRRNGGIYGRGASRIREDRGTAHQSRAGSFAMISREIDVHIEELVLPGFDPRSRWNVVDALANLFRGLPAAWRANPAQRDAGSMRLARKAEVGRQIVAAVYKGGER